MARCPNCEATIPEITAAKCPNCAADFDASAAWLPIATSPEEEKALAGLKAARVEAAVRQGKDPRDHAGPALGLRLAIFAAAIAGAAMHSAFGGRSASDVVHQLFTGGLWWIGLPYIPLVLAQFAIVSRHALWILLATALGIAALDAVLYSSERGDKGWYLVLMPILFLIPAIIGGAVALFVNWAETRR